MGCMATPPPALRAVQQQAKTAAQLIGERHAAMVRGTGPARAPRVVAAAASRPITAPARQPVVEAAAEAADPTWRLRVYLAGGVASLSASLASCAAPGVAAHADCDAPGNTAGDSAHELDAMMRKSAHVACVDETALPSAQTTAFWRASYIVGSAGSHR